MGEEEVAAEEEEEDDDDDDSPLERIFVNEPDVVESNCEVRIKKELLSGALPVVVVVVVVVVEVVFEVVVADEDEDVGDSGGDGDDAIRSGVFGVEVVGGPPVFC